MPTATQPPAKKERVGLNQIIGGGFELLEGIGQTITGTGPGFTIESGQNPAPDYPSEAKEPSNVTPFPSRGELRGFQNLSPEMKIAHISSELIEAQNETATKAPVEIKRTKINQLNGLQDSYQGSVDSQGNVTQYHQANAEKSENEALRIQHERDRKRFTANNKDGEEDFMGENELGLGGENKNHFTAAVG